ncbi:YhdP family protein [Pseudomarimonas salicorniae]|uniref:TIGR02099 family protein n=1 Tax=Pseudomarimonas salicorniae TaxID=2933270 RepID=A0ABT0GKR5_9GAMM|nr:YhdP family protein [Lysobacter sp. CAU 1642]MCK7595113.1 TIGR02099 family protein [Lysobacter sp. CAU 1642]
MSGWRRRLRRLRRVVLALLTGLLILAGLAVAVLSQLLPTLQSRPDEVAAFMQRQLGVPVELDAVQAEWTGSGVRLQLSGLRIGGADGPSVADATLWLRPFSGWWPGNTLSTLQVSRPELVVERRGEGDWQVRGLVLATRADGPLDLQLLDRIGEVVLDEASLQLRSEVDGLDLRLARVDGRMRPQGGQFALALQVFIDDSPPIRLRLHAAPDLRAGTLHLGLRRAPLDDWLGATLDSDWQLPPSLVEGDAWADWVDGRLSGLQFRARLTPEAASAASGDTPAIEDSAGEAGGDGGGEGAGSAAPLPALALEGTWLPLPDGGEWQLHDASGAAPNGWLRYLTAGPERSLQLTDWDLGLWWPWLSRSLPAAPPVRARLASVVAGGRIEALRVDWSGDGAPRWWVEARQLRSEAAGRIPGIAGLDLRAEGVGGQALYHVQADPLQLDWRSLAAPMSPAVRGDLVSWRDEAGHWCLHALDLALAEPEYSIAAEGGLCFDGGAPSADLRVAVAPADITVAKRFWVLDRMPEKAVGWLNEAIEAGRLERGALLLHGDLSDWPFQAGEGRMEALAMLDSLRLRYRPDWPVGEALSGEARFINDSMQFDGSAELAGIGIERVQGSIARFRESMLRVRLQAPTDSTALLRLLRATPLWKTLAPGLERVRAYGPAQADVGLQIPLKRELGAPRVDGSLLLEEVDLRHEEWGIAFDGASGPLRFTERGVETPGLDVLHVGRPARFELRVGAPVTLAANMVEARLIGRLDAGSLIDTQPELDWLKPSLSGVSGWDIGLEIPRDRSLPPVLELDSDLVGTALRLPAPLRKSPATPLPLALRVELAGAAKDVRLELGELMRLRGLWAKGVPFNGLASFGETAGEGAPEQGLAVIGQVPVLDLGGWIELGGSGGGMLRSIDLRSGELDLFGRGFGETRLRYSRDAEATRIGFEGERLQGEIEIPGAAELLQRGVTARFERMYWPADEQGSPGSSGKGHPIDPATVPPLHVHVEDLRVGAAELGNTRLEAYPQGGAMHIEQFTARSEALSLTARGDWLAAPGGSYSRFGIEFTAESLGGMLRALGFSEFVEGGQTLVTLEGEWPGPPSAFSLAEVNGRLSLSVGSGRIPDVDPGAGRLFGLFSLSEIPRRLALDFSDFFRSGLAFNRIEGDFVLEDGSAWTDELLIDSPSAEIRLRGRTGLRVQEYAQTMEVLPRAGNVLPVVGALAAGPAGAALGAVAQAVLQKPFKQITRTLYSVNGSWKDPDIDVIERGPARPAAPAEGGVPGP